MVPKMPKENFLKTTLYFFVFFSILSHSGKEIGYAEHFLLKPHRAWDNDVKKLTKAEAEG